MSTDSFGKCPPRTVQREERTATAHQGQLQTTPCRNVGRSDNGRRAGSSRRASCTGREGYHPVERRTRNQGEANETEPVRKEKRKRTQDPCAKRGLTGRPDPLSRTTGKTKKILGLKKSKRIRVKEKGTRRKPQAGGKTAPTLRHRISH